MKHLNDKLVKLAEDPEFPRFVTALYTVIDQTLGTFALPVWPSS